MLRKLYLARTPALILVSAGVILAMSRSERIHVDTGVKRYTTFLFPAHRTLRGEAPAKIIARAVFGLLKVDMSHTTPSHQEDTVWVDVTCIAGRIEIILPKEWEVQPGRVALARRIRFEGALPGTDIGPAEQSGQRDQNLVVINVLGWLGFVVVQRT